jgi:nucleoside-diphosphate-sugar epimerase
MRALVTGGAGRVGHDVVRDLASRGWDIRVVDWHTGEAIRGVQYAVCDVTRYDDLREHMRGCTAVAHLAAIASPMFHTGPEVLRVNALGTFNVFEAAASEGIRRVVLAGSINAFGCHFGVRDREIRYLPVDEDHRTDPTDPYSLSKNIAEIIGAYYWRRDGISSVALRIPSIWPEDWQVNPQFQRRLQEDRSAIDSLVALSDAERSKRLEAVRQRVRAFRRQRPSEYTGVGDALARRRALDDDPLARVYAFDRFDFWAAIDKRDLITAFRQALAADYEGNHTLFINDVHNRAGYDAGSLARLFYPEVHCWHSPLEGPVSLVSSDRAAALIGFRPVHPVVAGAAAGTPRQ